MKSFDDYIDNSLTYLDLEIDDAEDYLYESFNDDFVGDFDTEDGRLVPSTMNYAKANKANKKFDEIYLLFLLPIIYKLGLKLMQGVKVSSDYFESKGETTSEADFERFRKSIGITEVVDKLITGSFLANLGLMQEVRQQYQNFVINAITSGMKVNDFLRGTRKFFKSSKTSISAIQAYFKKYLGDAFNRMLNSANFYFSKKFGYDSFIYEGGLIERSRDFCIERDGNTYTVEEGESWNELQWKGKIEDVDFFIQVGGYNCRHHLTFIKQ